jgi:molybdenum-dependent DNA-binding transcriptional regulator ModE
MAPTTPAGRSRAKVILPRIRLGAGVLIRPGKIELLRAVAEHGSI